MRAGFVRLFFPYYSIQGTVDLANIFRRIFPILFPMVFCGVGENDEEVNEFLVHLFCVVVATSPVFLGAPGHCGTFLPLTCLSLSEIAGQHSIGDESHVTQEGEHT